MDEAEFGVFNRLEAAAQASRAELRLGVFGVVVV